MNPSATEKGATFHQGVQQLSTGHQVEQICAVGFNTKARLGWLFRVLTNYALI